MVVGLVLSGDLGALVLAGVLLVEALVGGAFLDVLCDVLADAADASELGLIISLALQNLLQQSLKPLHGNDLQVRIGCKTLKPGPVLLGMVILLGH